MQTKTLKDKNFCILGYLEIKDNGDKTLKDSAFRVKGYYEARTDVTKDDKYRVVGYGDLLPMLLKN